MLVQSTFLHRSGVLALAQTSFRISCPSGTWRLFASGRRGGGARKRPWAARRGKRNNEKEEVGVTTANASVNSKLAAAVATDTHSADSKERRLIDFVRWILPVRYRFPDARPYSREEGISIAQRIPIFIVLAALLSWDETSPYALVRIMGPSMLPTMAPDGSDVWLRSTWTWWRKFGLQPPYQRGDLVGFRHPNHPEHVSCKRIVGLPGDRVQRYGQYVHLFTEQDPKNFGMMWPEDKFYSWFDRKCEWDKGHSGLLADRQKEAKRTLVVPEGHVWLEADCPALGIDSRHFGPIPIDWLQGKIVARLWPLWRSSEGASAKGKRPHPIPLDKETLAQYNVFAVTPDPTNTD